MKTKNIITLLVVLFFIIASCEKDELIKPSNVVTIQDKPFFDFSKLDIGTAFTVFVDFSDTEEIIQIEANENLHQYIIVEEISGVLRISLQNNISISGNTTLKAYITTDNITNFVVSEASLVTLNNKLTTSNVNIELNSASSFIGELELTNLTANLSEASLMQLSGTADSFTANASGASNISDYSFSTNFLNINLSGASVAQLTINEEMDGVINSQNLSGASTIVKVD